MLEIKSLKISLADGGKEILKGLNLAVKGGEVHAIMGPNGAGKSTLGYVLAGREDVYALGDDNHGEHPGDGGAKTDDQLATAGGEVWFDGQCLIRPATDGEDEVWLAPEERALAGLFLAFQYPVELPGVNVAQYLRLMTNAHRVARGENELSAAQFLPLVKAELAALGLAPEWLSRAVNVGFSGGEKKRFEMLQMALVQPKLAVLDETDSGLDIDALRVVAESVNRMRGAERSFIIITHYQRLLDYIKPDFVHVLADGKIVETGGPELALRLEKEGYQTEHRTQNTESCA